MGEWRVFLRATLVCWVMGLVLLGVSLQKIEHLPLSSIPLKFEEKRAHYWMFQLARSFPFRVTWGEMRKEAATWLKGELKKLGYQPQGMVFSQTIAGKRYSDLENIYAIRPGTTHADEIIAMVAHYDIAETTTEGALDDASGVGVVLELARVFSQENPKRTLLFLLTDSEEYGAFWGAINFSKNFQDAKKIVAVLNFDFLAPNEQVAILTLSDGLRQGYTPLWLREMALESIRSMGTVEARDFQHVIEHVQRALQIPAADHGAFLAQGIPAFNWVGQTKNFAYQMAHYHHTRFDEAQSMRPESFRDYGKAAERLARSLDELSAIPGDFRESSYWKLTDRYYMPGWAAISMHVLAFIPFVILVLMGLAGTLKTTHRGVWAAVILNETKHLVILIASLLVGYAIMRFLPELKVVEGYEAFPATQKSPILDSPNLWAFAIVGLGAFLVYWVSSRVFSPRGDRLEYPEVRRGLHGVFLVAVIALAMLKNSYLATLLLIPPAYLWVFLRERRSIEGRLLNLVLILGGALTFIVMVVVMSTVFHVGVAYWYLFLSATYGLISAYSVVLFLIAAAMMIRLVRRFVLR